MLLDVGQSFTQDVEQMYMALSIQLKTLNLIFDAIVDAGTLLKFIQRGKNVLSKVWRFRLETEGCQN